MTVQEGENGNRSKLLRSMDMDTALKFSAFCAVVLGTAFEIGYFQSFGIEFLSLAGVTDWLFAACVVGLVATSMGLGNLVGAIMFDRFMFHPGSTKATFAKIALGIVGAFGGLTMLLGEYLKSAPAVILGVNFVVFLFACTFVRAVNHYAVNRPIPSVILMVGAACGVLLMMIGGEVYAATIAGRECMFSFKDGHNITAVYMRSLVDGYLAKIDDHRYYFPKSEVIELRCKGN